jgi:RimJ/RimL family protein N-acetyltransferase
VRHLTFAAATDPSQAIEFLRHCDRLWQKAAAFPLAISLKATGEVIGIIEPRPGDHGIQLGYVLRRSACNNGYMTEAVDAVTASALS